MDTQRAAAAPSRRFEILLIKPSHYDEQGYVIRWMRSTMPSNSLAVLNGIALVAAKPRVLGTGSAISVRGRDEANTRVRIPAIVKQFRRNNCFGLVGRVGVQSNEFPRAVDIARRLRQAGIKGGIGGFHGSGCLAMLPERP